MAAGAGDRPRRPRVCPVGQNEQIEPMIERARELGALRLAAILAAAVVLGGGAVWLLAGDSESSDTELANLPPEPAPATPPTSPGDETVGRPDHETDRKRERGRDREPRNRERAARHPRDGGTERSKPADEPEPEPERQNVNRAVENLLGGGGPSGGSSQAALSDVPPEVRALIQGGDEQGSSNPPAGLEDLLGGGSGGD
jgi:hypothetical protein